MAWTVFQAVHIPYKLESNHFNWTAISVQLETVLPYISQVRWKAGDGQGEFKIVFAILAKDKEDEYFTVHLI